MKLRHSARTDVGKTRDHNEDDYGVGEGAGVEQFGELLIVCDGMGGHAAGEVASRLGVETILSSYYSDSGDDRVEALRSAFERANARIHAEGRGTMGTTGVAALLYHDALHIANVGDSRAYLIRESDIRQISRDHSLVGEQIAAGVITAEQARSLYYRNVITRALGYQAEVTVDMFRYPLQPGDIIVLSSDGLHGMVTDEEIRDIALRDSLADAVDRLVDLANERGGSDNITLVLAAVDELDWTSEATETPAHERATEPLTEPPDPGATADPSAEHPALGAAPALTPRPAPAAPPTPRRLTPLGAIMATAMVIALTLLTLFVLEQPVLAPAVPPTAVATSIATPTGVATRAPTAGPTRAPTSAPTSGTRTPAPTP